MGVSNGSATLHSITDLTLAEVALLCRRVADNKGILPRVVADCSNLIYIFKGSYTPVEKSLANFFNKFTTAGIIVVPVCDGHVRPTAKQATNIRIASHKKTRITALQLRSQIQEIKDKLSTDDGTETVALHLELEKELRSAEKRVKQNETKSKDIIPPNFDVALADELCSHNAHNINGE